MRPGRRSAPASIPRRRPPARSRRATLAATTLAGALFLTAGTARVQAQEEAEPDAPDPASPPGETAGRPRRIATEKVQGEQLELEISIELASAYVFRGYNVFQAEHQREQKWVERPLVVWTVRGTGLSVGYAAANQITGDNLGSNVSAGLGAEQDLFGEYEFGRNARWGAAAELVLVAYPEADKRVTGTAVPFFVSASVEPRYRHRAFLYLGYLRGFRHGPLDRDQVYLNPRVEKRFAFGDRVELALQLGAGLKILQLNAGQVKDNMFDVLAAATMYYALNDVLYVGAKIGWAWTNLTSSRDPDTGEAFHPRFSDEYVPFWALVFGAELSAPPAPARRDPAAAAPAM